MSGTDNDIVAHNWGMSPKYKPIKQKSLSFPHEIKLATKEEVELLLEAKFIKPIQQLTWLANIVPVAMENTIRCCVDYRDLNILVVYACVFWMFSITH